MIFRYADPSITEVLLVIAIAVICGWSFAGLLYWINNPELTQMEVFKVMIGL